MIEVTVLELQQIVLGLSMLPVAADLHRRMATRLHSATLLPIPQDCRRVWWRSFRDGEETSIEFYDDATCDRVDRAIERAQRTPRLKSKSA